MYGRRRLGKTEILSRFVKRLGRGVYYMATTEDSQKQLRSISSLIGLELGDDELARFGAVDWEVLFLRIANRQGKARLAMVIDEFPYLARANASIPSIFQKGWDLYLKGANIVLVLCGSSISMMHGEILDYSAPLYQRNKYSIQLRPLSPKYALSLSSMAFEDSISQYFIFGGVPAYYSYTEGCKDMRQLLLEILKPGSAFLDEPSTILSEETRNEARYLDVIDLISNGVNRTNEIALKLGIHPSNTVRYLEVLERIGIISKVFPVTEAPPRRSKKGIYEICDNYMRFWFRHLKRRREAIRIEGSESAAQKILLELDSLGGRAFEDLCTEITKEQSGKTLPKFEKVGRWWGKNRLKERSAAAEEIDIVGINSSGAQIFFAECKWSRSAVGTDVYEDLKRKASAVEWGIGGRTEHFALFSRSGFTKELRSLSGKENLLLFDLKAIKKMLQ